MCAPASITLANWRAAARWRTLLEAEAVTRAQHLNKFRPPTEMACVRRSGDRENDPTSSFLLRAHGASAHIIGGRLRRHAGSLLHERRLALEILLRKVDGQL